MVIQDSQSGNDGCIQGLGPFGDLCQRLGSSDGGGVGVLQEIAKIISRVIGIITIAAGIWFLFQFLIAAFSWLTSGGDAQKIADAQHRIFNALIGLTLVVAALTLMSLVSTFFGIDFLLKKPGELAPTLAPPPAS